MNTDRELMQQALEALEYIEHNYMSLPAPAEKAITALRERLAQPEQSYPDNFIDALKYDVAKRDSEAQQAYEDAFVNGTGVMLGDKRIDPAIIYKQPEQEPVARSDAYDMIDRFLHNNLNSDADYAEYSKALDSIYTIPPQRKPLSMQERTSIVRANKSFHDKDEIDAYGIIDDVEAAHGIKE